MKLPRLLLSRSPLLAAQIALGLEHPAASVAMKNVGAWAGLKDVVGRELPPATIVTNVSQLRRDETVFTLARIAADLANADGGVLGADALAWTHDLLTQRTDSANPREATISRAVTTLPRERAIAHAQVVFTLQALAMAHGGKDGVVPHDGYLAFTLLALNDHLPEWPEPPKRTLSDTEQALASLLLSSVFNRNEDPLRFLVRSLSVLGRHPRTGPISATDWSVVQELAFGTSFNEYAESFLVPLFLMSMRWGNKEPPIVWRHFWLKGAGIRQELIDRWLAEASVPADQAALIFGSRPFPSGLLGLPGAFFRTPMVAFDEGKLVALSPWHVRDHLTFGTWGKLNAACKKKWKTDSNDRFASHFGYQFEDWCAEVAREASAEHGFRDRLVLPTHPGADDEIEDVVLQQGQTVALMSAKASLVPEGKLKSAKNIGDVIDWLERFFFEDRADAKSKGYRGGAILQLDKHIEMLRAGAFANRGIDKDATVLPAIICFDNVGESGILYKWLEEECERRGLLSARSGVRPVTVIEAKDYEALMAVGARQGSVCELLLEKTDERFKWGRLERLLVDKVGDSTMLRLRSWGKRFEDVVALAIERLKETTET